MVVCLWLLFRLLEHQHVCHLLLHVVRRGHVHAEVLRGRAAETEIDRTHGRGRRRMLLLHSMLLAGGLVGERHGRAEGGRHDARIVRVTRARRQGAASSAATRIDH